MTSSGASSVKCESTSDGEAAGAGVGADSIRVAITSDTPLDTTRAFLKQLIIAGAPWARSFAVAAASRRATPYNACPASGHAVQLLKVENLWQSFDCVRLTLCSTETRHYYECYETIKLSDAHFSSPDEIARSCSTTALVLFDVDSQELLGVWKAVKTAIETQEMGGVKTSSRFIYWQVLKRLPGMRQDIFQASAAGSIFPSLPPTYASACARGHDARLVLRVLCEHAGSRMTVNESAMMKGSTVASTQAALVCTPTPATSAPSPTLVTALPPGPVSGSRMLLTTSNAAATAAELATPEAGAAHELSSVAPACDSTAGPPAISQEFTADQLASKSVLSTNATSQNPAAETPLAQLHVESDDFPALGISSTSGAQEPAAGTPATPGPNSPPSGSSTSLSIALAGPAVAADAAAPGFSAAPIDTHVGLQLNRPAFAASGSKLAATFSPAPSDATAAAVISVASAHSAMQQQTHASTVISAFATAESGPSIGFSHFPDEVASSIIPSSGTKSTPASAVATNPLPAPFAAMMASTANRQAVSGPAAATARHFASPIVPTIFTAAGAGVGSGLSVPQPPPSGGNPPPPVYLPPVLMLQRNRHTAQAAASMPAGASVVVGAAPAGTVVPVVARAPAPMAAVEVVGWTPAAKMPVGLQGSSPRLEPANYRLGAAATAAAAVPVAPAPFTVTSQQVTSSLARQSSAMSAPTPVMASTVPVPVLMAPPQLGNVRPTFLTAILSNQPPSLATNPGSGATQSMGTQADIRPVRPDIAATVQPVVRPGLGWPMSHVIGSSSTVDAQLSVSRCAVTAAPVLSAPFIAPGAPPMPTWDSTPVTAPGVAVPVAYSTDASASVHDEALVDTPALRLPSSLSCLLCHQRTGRWFLLDCKHMGPCEECCADPDQVVANYPACMRCGKAVMAKKLFFARVS